MKSRFTRNLLVAVALPAIGGSAVAGMSMGSSSSRNDDRGSGYYPGYGAGGSGGRPCRGNGPCTRDADRQDYGQGMRMGGGQQRQQYRNQYRYGQGGPGYGRGGQGYAPRVPADVQEDQDASRSYPRGPGYGWGGPGYAPGVPGSEPGEQGAYQGYPRGGPGYGRGGQGYAPGASGGEPGGQDDYQGYPQGGPGYGRGGQGGAPYYRQGGGF
jgi:hypothetical protein